MPGATPPPPSATDPVSGYGPQPLSPAVKTGSESRLKDRIAIAVLLCTMAFLSLLTWKRWGSLLIDCGQEMHIPAALSQGKRLYFDLWHADWLLEGYRPIRTFGDYERSVHPRARGVVVFERKAR